MFNFIHKKNIISTKDGIDVFTAKVDPIITRRWIDVALAKKLGIAPEKFFSGTATVSNHNMSYDDAFACLRRVIVLFGVTNYVNEKFNATLSSLNSSADKQKYCDLDTLLDLIDEAKMVKRDDIDAPKDVQDAINRINGYLIGMGPMRNMFIPSITMAIMANNVDMTASI